MLIEDPGSASVLHTCDNEQCINVRHLYLGDHRRNALDVSERSPTFRGKVLALHAKLTEADVLAIRSSTETIDVLAERLGVNRITVWDARTGRTWKDLPNSCNSDGRGRGDEPPPEGERS